MSTPDELTASGIRALKAGDRQTARRLLTQAVSAQPQNARAWLWLAACLDDPERQRFCLQKAADLQPDEPGLQAALQQYQARREADEPDEGGPPADGVATQRASLSENGLAVEPLSTTAHETAPALDEATSPSAADAANLPEDRKALTSAPPSGAPPAAPGRKPMPTRRSRPAGRLGPARFCLLAALALIAAAAVLAGLWIVLPDLLGGLIPGLSPFPAYGPSDGVPPDNVPATLAIALPPTWTATLSPEPGATARQPSATLSSEQTTADPTPVPSLTPGAVYRLLVIGRSVENRPIEVYRFGAGRRERMIIAGIHGGDEQNAIDLAGELIDRLSREPDLVPPGYTLYILKALNPDGSAAGKGAEGRSNANGVDLNRNFDTNWKSTWRTTGCQAGPGAAGSSPGSEPETQAIKNFLLERRVEALIVYHSAGLGVFPSGEPAHPDSVRLAKAIAALGDYDHPPVDTGCEYTGTLVDWAADHGIPAAVDLELNDPDDTELEANLAVLKLLLSFPIERPTPSVLPSITLEATRPDDTRLPPATPTGSTPDASSAPRRTPTATTQP